MNVKMACRISATFLEKEYWLKDGLAGVRASGLRGRDSQKKECGFTTETRKLQTMKVIIKP
jgi:hypothetical protein